MACLLMLAAAMLSADPPKEFAGVRVDPFVDRMVFIDGGKKLFIEGRWHSFFASFHGNNYIESLRAYTADASGPKVGEPKRVYEWRQASSNYVSRREPRLNGLPYVIAWRHDEDSRCDVIDPMNGKVVFKLASPTGSRERPISAAATPDLKLVAIVRERCSSGDGFAPKTPPQPEVVCWREGEPKGRVIDKCEKSRFSHLQFLDRGRILAGVGVDRVHDSRPESFVRVWNTADGKIETEILVSPAHSKDTNWYTELVTAICADDKGRRLFVTNYDGRVLQVDLQTKSVVDRSVPRPWSLWRLRYPGLYDVVWDAKTRRVFAVGGDRNRGNKYGVMVKLAADAATPAEYVLTHQWPIDHIAISPDGRLALSSYNQIMLIDAPP